MLVARITCHCPPSARQWASLTVKVSEPPSDCFSVAVGSLLRSIELQPLLCVDGHPVIEVPDPPEPACAPLPGPHRHHDTAATASSAAAAVPKTNQRRLRLVGTVGSPRSDRT